MSDVLLDAETNDVDVSSGTTSLVTGREETRQRLAIRLALVRGEYPYDRAAGVDWYGKILGNKNMVEIDAELRRAILTTTGIVKLKKPIEYNRDPITRILQPKFTAIDQYGEEIEMEV